MPDTPCAERISDSDRVAAIARLHDLLGGGDLGIEQFSASLEQVLAAESQMELETAIGGFPSVVRLTPASRKLKQPVCLDAAINRLEIGAGWQLGTDTTIKTNTGSVRIDLCEATWDAREVDLHLQTTTGEIDVIVPKGVLVQIVSMIGKVTLDNLASALPGGPILRVYASTKAGRIRFAHELPPQRRRRWAKQPT